jgi:hypothetical protein
MSTSEAHRRAARKWALANPEKRREISRRWRAKNPDRHRALARARQQSPKGRAYRQAYRAANKEKIRELARAYKYGLGPGQFEQLLAAQGARCAICRHDKPRGLNWHVDHDHETGRLRGILCKGCNTALGAFGDNLSGILDVLEYLQRAERSDDKYTHDKETRK